MKKVLLAFVLLSSLSAMLWAGGTSEPVQKVELEVVFRLPEYLEVEKQIWDIYMERNPHVNVQVNAVNEDQRAAFAARLAAGDAPAVAVQHIPEPDKDNYKTFVDLRTIEYPYWDLIRDYDPMTVWSQLSGVDYVPGVYWQGGRYMSFIYYKDEMAKTGLNPRENVRTWDQLDSFLQKLKGYVESTPSLSYTFDYGWHAWVNGFHFIPPLAHSLGGGNLDVQEKLWRGEISWTDQNNNPLVPAFKKLKEWTDEGILPARWWTREWENEYEASFIGRNSILCFHGPWMWSKTEAADASAKLSGFPLPAHNGTVVGISLRTVGAGIYAANQGKPEWEEIVAAFVFAASPEAIKLRCEGQGAASAFDLSSEGGLELTSTQAKELIQPLQKGYFGDIKMDFGFRAAERTAAHKKAGKPNVLNDNAAAQILGEYFAGEYDLAALLELLQARWEDSYDF
jgi:ABC-type glycerol-3-phosphate transport system substrate-binding protein